MKLKTEKEMAEDILKSICSMPPDDFGVYLDDNVSNISAICTRLIELENCLYKIIESAKPL